MKLNSYIMPRLLFKSTVILCFYFIFGSGKTLAQITPDSTLGKESSQVNSIDELRDRIEGGAIRGNDLFHSFQEFNVGEGASVNFANPQGIENIFSRVTGGNISQIFGTLSVDGLANLFLLNPNGIVFGENSAINVNGSFLATTAENIEFDNGDRFSATSPNLPSLKISIPIGLGFGSNPGNIQINGKQNNVQVEFPSFKVVSGNYSSGLKVNSDKNISLIGGDINFNGGGLQASSGDIEVVSVDKNRTVQLVQDNDWFNVDFANTFQFGNITLDNAAYIDVSDNFGGNIVLAGRNILLNKGSVILANTIFNNTDNAINIYASEFLEIKGTSGDNEINISTNILKRNNNDFQNDSNFYSVSLIRADVLPSQSNQKVTGADININAKKIRVLDAGEIRAANFLVSNSTTGTININAKDILISGTNNIDGLLTSEINSTTGSGFQGGGGDINISTSVLNVQQGGRIKVDVLGSDRAVNTANITIEADRITLFDDQIKNFASSSKFRTGLLVIPDSEQAVAGGIDITSQSLSVFNADINSSSFQEFGINSPGSIKINTQDLKVLDGGAITAETAAGDAKDITIDAENIELIGTKAAIFRGQFTGGISTSSNLNSSGNGGDIRINTNSLKILDGSIIRAISLGSGDAGNININAQEIEISGVDRFALDPVASERVSKINTASLKTNGGNLTISSDSINLDNFGKIQATSVQGDRGGNIIIGADNLILSNQSNVTASAGGAGNGGNISIDSDVLAGLDNSDITANAVAGNGGNIEIESSYIIGLDSRNQLSPFSDITASSELGIDGTVTINSPETNTEEDTVIAAEDIKAIAGEEIREASCLNSHFEKVRVVDTGFGLPPSPYNYSYDNGLANLDNLNPNQQVKKSSRITPVDWKPGDPIVEANAIKTLPDGRQFFVAVESTSPLDSHLCTR